MTAELAITGKPCGHCQTILQPGDPVAVCTTCGAVHHAACWAFNGHCSSAECDGTPTQQVAPPAGAFGAPAGVMPPPASYVPPTPAPPTITMPGVGTPGVTNVPPDTAPGALLSYAWSQMQRDVGNAIVAYLIFSIISGAPGNIPYIGPLIALFLTPPLQAGYTRFALNFVNNRGAQLNDIFTGFAEYGKWLALSFIIIGITLACIIPGGILIAIGAISAGMSHLSTPASWPASTWGMMGGGVALMLIISLFVTPRFIFAWYLAYEGRDAMDAVRASNEMAQGRLGQVIWLSIVLGLVNFLGLLVCGVGMLFTAPLTTFALALYYNAIKVECRMT